MKTSYQITADLDMSIRNFHYELQVLLLFFPLRGLKQRPGIEKLIKVKSERQIEDVALYTSARA